VPIARITGFTGRMMIRAGILILLFVAYQLWGTGLHTARAQDSLRDEFRAKQAELGQLPGESPPATPDTSTTTSSTTLAPTTAATDIAIPAPGEPIGFISIPDIASDFYMVEGVDLRWLEEGPGHFPSTPLPGQPGNAALAGHRTTYKAPFNRIDELQAGALIFIETLQGKFTYEVLPQPVEPGDPPTAHYIVGPRQTEILDDKGDNRLTLMACHPKYSAAQRIVVEAKLVSNPAPPTPRPPAATVTLPGDLAGGDNGARLPALALSVAAIAVWVAAWYVGRRKSSWKWPAYAIAFPFFAVLLFFAFDNINRLLPAAY
jgi:sortase A